MSANDFILPSVLPGEPEVPLDAHLPLQPVRWETRASHTENRMNNDNEAAPDGAARYDEEVQKRVLVVGDDANMTAVLTTMVRSAGYSVRTAGAGGQAAATVEQWRPDVMLQDGFEVSRYTHGERCTVPAVFLTPGEQFRHKVPGLTLGGGDYVTKPFSSEELNAQIRALLRRTTSNKQAGHKDSIIRFADLELNEETYSASRAGRILKLSPTEFSLLRYLMRNAEKVLTKAQILDHVWPYNYAGHEGAVHTYMARLRRKVDQINPPLIHTVRGFGRYSLREPFESEPSDEDQ